MPLVLLSIFLLFSSIGRLIYCLVKEASFLGIIKENYELLEICVSLNATKLIGIKPSKSDIQSISDSNDEYDEDVLVGMGIAHKMIPVALPWISIFWTICGSSRRKNAIVQWQKWKAFWRK